MSWLTDRNYNLWCDFTTWMEYRGWIDLANQ